MKGYLTTYAALFETQPREAPSVASIEIPLIQRDYAQGRISPKVEEIRLRFLESLLGAVAGDTQIALDFIYGKVEEDTLHPLDGQQRLTTLFLLHWYLASATGNLDPSASWARFSYATRPSARTFCNRLALNPLPPETETPSAWIIDHAWYQHVWRHDPTIQSMLVMIDAIDDSLRELHPGLDLDAAWKRLTDPASPAISFYLLPLDDMDSDEELYVKMNSRGKPLTDFENFKALFEQDIAHSDRAEAFAHKIDGAWSDLMWPFHGGDNIVDDEFIRYIDYITEICEFREGKTHRDDRRLGHRARSVFGPGNARSDENLNFLFDAFDAWHKVPDVTQFHAEIFSLAHADSDAYVPGKVVLFPSSPSTNLFELCCHTFDSSVDGNRPFSLQQSLMLYAVLTHLIVDSPDFPQRLRTVRNLVAASDNEVRREFMPELLSGVRAVMVDGDLDAARRFNSNQLEDERLKQTFLSAHPELTDSLYRLEDHPLLRGALTSFDLDPKTFAAHATAFEKAFKPANWRVLTGALLATGDYYRPRKGRGYSWQFGTSVAANDAVWRTLLTGAPRDTLAPTRTVLGNFLEGVASADTGIAEHLRAVTENWLTAREEAEIFDWRYYLVKYPSMRDGGSGIYFGLDEEPGYSMCMLLKSNVNSWYRDPILLQIWVSGNRARIEDPWFTGWETTERWLQLTDRATFGLTSLPSGLGLQRPQGPKARSVFDKVCSRRTDVIHDEHGYRIEIPQKVIDGHAVDVVDRVQVALSFLDELIAAGL